MKTSFSDREEITFVWIQEMWSFLGDQSFLQANDRQRRCAKHRQVEIRKAIPKGLQNGTKKNRQTKKSNKTAKTVGNKNENYFYRNVKQ